ncbi:Serine/threonine-protein kinase PknB [compost metagenome]
MLHQDLRPDNVMIDSTDTVKIIDFGSTRVAGLAEIGGPPEHSDLLGTAAYTAPEYFLGDSGSPRSDLFSLAVITYQMLTGQLPYGTQVANARSKAAQHKLSYQPARDHQRAIPPWIDDVLKKALHPNPDRRYPELSEFIFELRHPSQEFISRTRPPLMERNPLLFWKSVSFILLIIIVAMVSQR